MEREEYTAMRRSAEVRDTLRFYEVFSAADLEGLSRMITQEDRAILVVGTAPNDWIVGRERWVAAREALTEGMWEGLRLEAGEEPLGYEEGSMGWVADRSSVVMADGATITTRLTGIVCQEGGGWRLVHVHLSVGVPDEEVVELQKRWSS